MSKSHFAWVLLPLSLALAGCTGSEPMIPYPAAEEAAASPALRARTDLARGLRWELRWGSVAVHEVGTERLVRTIALPGAILSGAPESCLPDLVLDRSGAAWISSNAAPVLWRVSPGRFEIERFEIALDDPRDVGFSALAFGADEREIYAASAATGTLWRIEVATAKAARVELTAPIAGACGLRLLPGQGSLREPLLSVAVGRAAGAQRVRLAEGGRRGAVQVMRRTELAAAP